MKLPAKDKSRIAAALAAKNQTVSGTWHRLIETGSLSRDLKPSELGTTELYAKKPTSTNEISQGNTKRPDVFDRVLYQKRISSRNCAYRLAFSRQSARSTSKKKLSSPCRTSPTQRLRAYRLDGGLCQVVRDTRSQRLEVLYLAGQPYIDLAGLRTLAISPRPNAPYSFLGPQDYGSRSGELHQPVGGMGVVGLPFQEVYMQECSL